MAAASLLKVLAAAAWAAAASAPVPAARGTTRAPEPIPSVDSLLETLF